MSNVHTLQQALSYVRSHCDRWWDGLSFFVDREVESLEWCFSGSPIHSGCVLHAGRRSGWLLSLWLADWDVERCDHNEQLWGSWQQWNIWITDFGAKRWLFWWLWWFLESGKSHLWPLGWDYSDVSLNSTVSDLSNSFGSIYILTYYSLSPFKVSRVIFWSTHLHLVIYTPFSHLHSATPNNSYFLIACFIDDPRLFVVSALKIHDLIFSPQTYTTSHIFQKDKECPLKVTASFGDEFISKVERKRI